jgi:hypothetical protein
MSWNWFWLPVERDERPKPPNIAKRGDQKVRPLTPFEGEPPPFLSVDSAKIIDGGVVLDAPKVGKRQAS